MVRALCLLLAVSALAVACGGGDKRGDGGAPAATQADGARLEPLPELIAGMQPSVVAIQVAGARERGERSGVIWDSGGTIVTNHHVVAGARDVTIRLASGRRLAADVRATDPLTDLAVLDVDATDLPAADFADALPRVGETVVALGNPAGFEGSATAGIVSGLHRAIPSGGRTPALVDLLQTDAPISPGNSGGALVDPRGRVVGVNVAYLPPLRGAVAIGFAIPAPTVRDTVQDLLEDGEVRHAFLGVTLLPLTDAVADRFAIEPSRGAIIAGVEPGSPADAAGLRSSDVIVDAGDRPVESIEDVYAVLRGRDPGDVVTLRVSRDGRLRDLEARLVARPPAAR